MSRRPGIGMLAIEPLIEALNSNAGALFIAQTGDVPVAFLVGGRMLPLGRVVRDRLRMFFFGEPGQPALAKQLRERKFNASLSFVPVDASPVLRARLLALFPQEAKEAHSKHRSSVVQKGRQVAARHKIFSSVRKL